MIVDTREDLPGAIRFLRIDDRFVWIHPSAVGAVEEDTYKEEYSVIRLRTGYSFCVKYTPQKSMKKLGWREIDE